MTSRKTGRIPAAPRAPQAAGRRPATRTAPRPAGMSVARAITKTLPAGTAPKGLRAKAQGCERPKLPPRPAAPLPAASPAIAPAASPAIAPAPRLRGSYKVSSRTDQQRLADLKVKLGDPDYMEGAILRIATVLSARLTLR
jgi:hypothetical protein